MSSTSSGPNNTLGLTPRPQTPPYYLSFSARNVIPPDFTAFRPKDVKAQSTIKEPVMQCSWNADGHRLATCGHEKVVRLWMPEKTLNPKETTATSGGHGAIATSVAWSPKHPELFCSSSETEKSMVFWDARKKGPTFQLKTPTPLTQLQYCPDGESVALLDKSFHLHRLQLNKLPAGEDSWELTDPSLSTVESITDFKFNHPGDLIFASSKSGSIHCVEYPSMNVIEIFNAHFGACNTLDLDPRGRFMATGGSDGMINIFNNVEVVIHKAINVTDLPVHRIAYSFDGEYLAVAVAGSDILIASSISGQVMHRGIRQVGSPAWLAWHPSRFILASCGDHPTTSAGKSGWISVIGLTS